MFPTLMKLWNNEDGATAIEYGLIVSSTSRTVSTVEQDDGTASRCGCLHDRFEIGRVVRVPEMIVRRADDRVERVAAAPITLDRAGPYATAETRVTMGLENDTETLARIKLLAERNGIPLAQLLGARHAKMIEATAVDEKA